DESGKVIVVDDSDAVLVGGTGRAGSAPVTRRSDRHRKVAGRTGGGGAGNCSDAVRESAARSRDASDSTAGARGVGRQIVHYGSVLIGSAVGHDVGRAGNGAARRRSLRDVSDEAGNLPRGYWQGLRHYAEAPGATLLHTGHHAEVNRSAVGQRRAAGDGAHRERAVIA